MMMSESKVAWRGAVVLTATLVLAIITAHSHTAPALVGTPTSPSYTCGVGMRPLCIAAHRAAGSGLVVNSGCVEVTQ
jgi:hypothetical protein